MAAFELDEDFDREDVYRRYEAAVLSTDTHNIVIDFDSNAAFAAKNIDLKITQSLLQTAQAAKSKTRWIILWGPERQKDIVEALATHYGFSPRLFGLMCSDPDKPKLAPVNDDNISAREQSGLGKIRFPNSRSTESSLDDIEMAHKAPGNSPPMLDINHYRVVNQFWHYCSVDPGSKYLCIGFNSLRDPPTLRKTQASQRENLPYVDEEESRQDKPNGLRLWTWLILCNDGTVISMHENDSPWHLQNFDEGEECSVLQSTRQHLLNTFRQLSKSNESRTAENPIMTLPIRLGLQKITGNGITSSDHPGLLFCYLFDDWYAGYSLVAQKGYHQFGVKLRKIRKQMFVKPEFRLIHSLHHIGRQLAVLKQMYESYAIIIDRILDRQNSGKTALKHRPSGSIDLEAQSRQLAISTTGEPLAGSQTLGVSLSPEVVVRFERSRDRIKLYALSEIQACLDEKESLVFLNFNLITLGQSRAMERLTRNTVLLAKVTIMFMPVSLMTAYFSVQIEGIENAYNVKTYWAAFGIITSMSLIFLFAFERISDTLESGPIYKSLTATFIEFSRNIIQRSRRNLKT